MHGTGDVGDHGDLQAIQSFFAEAGKASLHEGFVINNVALNRYDARLFRELLDGSQELRDLARTHDAPPTFGALLLDIFCYLYKVRLALLDEADVDPAHFRANRPFIQRMADDEQTSITRLTTCMDEVASSLATVEAGRKILEELRRRPDLQDWMNRQSDSQSTDHGSQAQQDPSPDPSPDPSASARPAQPPATEDPAPAAGLRALVRAASEAASTEAGEHADALRGWGLEPKDLRVVALGERLELARKLRTRRMRDLADLLGRMRNQRRATERRKVRASRDEIHAIETSGDISRALPSERAAAFGSNNPYRKRDFYRRLSERSVLSYSLRTEEPVGRGAVIAMIDSSGSMSGEPMQWASAVALALAHAARGGARGGASRGSVRPVRLIFFNARLVLEVALTPGEKDVRKLLAVGTVDATGGTDYVPPLERALQILSDDRPTTTADMLLVTDGHCELPEPFADRLREEKAARGFKLISVLVGEGAREGDLGNMSEQVIRADDLARASGARDAASRVFENL